MRLRASGLDLNTYYTYDLLNHLTPGHDAALDRMQTRTLNYNNTGYLQSATNPENGTGMRFSLDGFGMTK